MGLIPPLFALLSASFLLASCNRPAIDSSQSLVGAKQIPSSKILSREIIQINRGFGQISEGLLSYELRPDNTLVVTLTVQDRKTFKEAFQSKETFHLESRVAAEARQTLWRLRPEKLQGVEWETRPTECERRGPHDFGEVAVVFISEGPKPGVNDDRVGVFELPHSDSCGTRHAIEARNLLKKVMQSFPPSKVTAEFERRAKLRR